MINQQYSDAAPAARAVISDTLWLVFLSFMVFSGVAAWLIVLAHENRRAAEAESARQTNMLMDEIDAHRRTDAELQKAKEVAESANLAKSRYIVGLSHEIRTPLNSIFGYAQLLDRGTSVPSGNAVRVIRRSAEHLANLIDGLLDISKIEGGMLKLNRDRVQLPEFLEQLANMFRLQAATKGIDFQVQLPKNLPTYVYTDQKRLRQILINLLSNAIKYTDKGYAALRMQYRSQVAEFEISDTGVGIPADEIERVFQPFERGHAPHIKQIPGTGLGLTITQLLTEIMGGDIQVRSSPETGTVFTVRLMLSEANQPSPTDSPRPIQDYLGARVNLLIIDDDPQHIDIVKSLLAPLNFQIDSAENATQGLQRALELRPDLAMIDISLPDMKGWQLAETLRQHESLQHMKILMVSANAHEFNAGGEGHTHDGFVMKPVDLQLLVDAIGSLLRLKWVYAASGQFDSVEATIADLPESMHTHLDELHKLGRIGHVRGIQAKLQELETLHPDHLRVVQPLKQMIDNFDLKKFMSTIETLRRHG